MINLFLIFQLFFGFSSWAESSEAGFFSGRISKINYEIKTVRIRVDFDNVKYINVKDRLEFWEEKNSTFK